MTTQHPEREAGQRWEWIQSERRRVITLLSRKEDGSGWRVAVEGRASTNDWFRDNVTDTDWDGSLCELRLLSSPSTSPASGPPEEYKPCVSECGRWVRIGTGPCGKCCGMDDEAIAHLAFPDWTPPLESKPAETATGGWCKLCGCGNDSLGYAHLESCDRFKSKASMSGGSKNSAEIVTHRDDCSRTDHLAAACPPVQETPKGERRAIDGFWYSNDEGQRIGPYPTAEARDINSRAYSAWMAAQSGTPYAGPEQIDRRLAHQASSHDDDLVTW